MSHSKETRRTIAFVMYQGLTDFDLIGPLQVLARFTRFAPQYEVSVVAERLEPIVAESGITYLPDQTFDQLLHPYAVVVPGGGIPTLRTMSNPAVRKYLLSTTATAEAVLSVCTGSLILASVGLFKGRTVPTHWAFAKYLENFEARYVRERWVMFDKFVVTAGVSAGIDGALALVARISDQETARLVQLSIEYDPQPPGRIDYSYRNSLARILLAGISFLRPFYTARPKRWMQSGI